MPVSESEKTYKVSGLKKIRKYKVSSLYKYMHLRTGGVDGSENCYAHVYMDKKIHDIIGYGAGTPDVGETPRILKNGDSITPDIESWTRYVNKCLYNKGRQLIYDNKTLTFTVRGLASPKTVDCKDVLSELDKMAGIFQRGASSSKTVRPLMPGSITPWVPGTSTGTHHHGTNTTVSSSRATGSSKASGPLQGNIHRTTLKECWIKC